MAGKDQKTITEIFQLNEMQQEKMEAWAAELWVRNRLMEEALERLFRLHPQSSQEDLKNLARKYDSITAGYVKTSKKFDQKLLGLFNLRQYERYLALCKAANRVPLRPIESVKDTLTPE